MTVTPQPLQSHRMLLWVAGGWPQRAPFRRAARWDGACFMSINTSTKGWLTVEEFQTGVAYLQQQRASQAAFDSIMSGDTSGERDDAIAKVRAYADAGATWWVEEGLGWAVDALRVHIKRARHARS